MHPTPPSTARDYRATLVLAASPADAGCRHRCAADGAAWLWHPAVPPRQSALLRFQLAFTAAPGESELALQVSADQRFQLRLDGEVVSFGPDYADPAHWAVAACRLPITPGAHRLEALVWWLGDQASSGPRLSGDHTAVAPPMTQMTRQGGFLLAGEAAWADRLTTGRAPWRVSDLTPAVTWTRRPMPVYQDIGPSWRVDLARWQAGGEEAAGVVVVEPVHENAYGVHRPGWRLQPTELPEQRRCAWSGGRVRAVTSDHDDRPFRAADEQDGRVRNAMALLGADGNWTVPEHATWTLLWDFEDYRCGYPALQFSGGAGGQLEVEWAEALYEAPRADAVTGHTSKGQRDVIRDKVFLGFGDTFLADGAVHTTPPFWWRAGRYLRLRVRTGAQPLHLHRLAILETGYPLELKAEWSCSDARLMAAVPLLRRALQASAHEVWADSPYYEQLPYVGDNVIECLCSYVAAPDDRLCRRAIELFNWSRRYNGLVAERYPSAWPQSSLTYALLWPTLLEHHGWWRDDAAFIRRQLPGLRAMMEEALALAGDGGLLGRVPGWSFVDWVPGWKAGTAPGADAGDSSLVNLHLLRALRSAARLEEAFGEPELRQRLERRATEVAARIRDRYWDEARGLVRDTSDDASFSEHAQCLALLGGLLDETRAERCRHALFSAPGLSRCTVYFTHYLFEAIALGGDAERLHQALDFWRGLPQLGFRALPEAPEPSRSDCHGWSAHPLFHLYATVAGIRPDRPGFASVLVQPRLGPLQQVQGACVHPRGMIRFDLRREGPALAARVDLPARTGGRLVWQGQAVDLQPGANRHLLPG